MKNEATRWIAHLCVAHQVRVPGESRALVPVGGNRNGPHRTKFDCREDRNPDRNERMIDKLQGGGATGTGPPTPNSRLAPVQVRPLGGPSIQADARSKPAVRPSSSAPGRHSGIDDKGNRRPTAPGLRTAADEERGRRAHSLLDSRVQLFRRDPGYRDDLLKITTSLIGSRCAWEDALGFVAVLRQAGIEPNVQVYGALLARAERERLPGQVLETFDEMRSRGIALNAIVCTPVIGALGRLDRSEDAEQLLRTMEAQGQTADIKVFGALLAAYARGSDPGAVAAVERLHDELVARGLVPDARVIGARLQAHANAGLLDQAFALFQTLLGAGSPPHVGVCNILIAACEQHGASMRAVEVFKTMVERGTQPNSATFAALVRTCMKAGSPHVTLSAVDTCIACGLVRPSAGYDTRANRLSLWAGQVLTGQSQWQLSAAALADVGRALAQFHLARSGLSAGSSIEGPEAACRSAAQAVRAWRSSPT